MKTNKTTGVACAAAWLSTNFLWMTSVPGTAHAVEQPTQTQLPAASATEAVEIEVFQGPRMVRPPQGDPYPLAEKRAGGEGWVELNMMIDPKGKPYEIMVVDSSGNPEFEKAAMKATGLASFEPARRGRTPIDSSYTWTITFRMDRPDKGASADFVSAYKQAASAIEAANKDEAEGQLDRMHPRNLYEDAFRHYIEFQYHRKWGTSEQQQVDLKRAVAGQKKPEFLPEDIFKAALIQLFNLEVRARDYGGALDVWKTLEPLARAELRDQLQHAVDQIHAVQVGSDPVRMSASIGRNSDWHGELFRNRFSIEVRSGSVSEVKLRCEKQYLFFKWQADIQYSIGSKADRCSIEVVGDPGTTFDLVQ
jgi:TonB family protein